MENKRTNCLLELKDEQQRESHIDTTIDPAINGETEGDDINNFIKEVVERKKARKQQLEIVYDFFDNPAAYGVDTDIIPSSTSEDEIDARKKELQHKIDLLRSVLKALEGEMQLLSEVKISDEANVNPGNDQASSTQQTILEKKAAAEKKAPRNRSIAKKTTPTKAAAKKAATAKTK